MSKRLRKSVRHLFLWMLMGCLCCSPAVAFGATDVSGGYPVEQPADPDPLIQTVLSISASFTKISNVQAYAYIHATSTAFFI